MNPGLARALGTMLKQDFQRAVLACVHQMDHDEGRSRRPVPFVCDEYQAFATTGENEPSGDEKFFSLARQARCIPLVATQSISSLRSAAHWGILAHAPTRAANEDLVFLDFDEPLIARLAKEPGYERATVPLALFRGVNRPIPTVMRPNHLIYVRDDAPDDFAYAVAKALDEHRDLFQVQLEPWYYD